MIDWEKIAQPENLSAAEWSNLTNQIIDMADRLTRYEAALREIGAYTDTHAQNHLYRTGSYGSFDEPGSVEIARIALGETQ